MSDMDFGVRVFYALTTKLNPYLNFQNYKIQLIGNSMIKINNLFSQNYYKR